MGFLGHGNKNRFMTQEACENSCGHQGQIQEATRICKQPLDTGDCDNDDSWRPGGDLVRRPDPANLSTSNNAEGTRIISSHGQNVRRLVPMLSHPSWRS